jgi:acyl carrier protein
MIMDYRVIEDAVLEVLEDILGRSRTTFTLEDRFVRDLRISSDDLTFVFVPNLEKRLNVKVPIAAWGEVETGRDVIALLQATLRRQEI